MTSDRRVCAARFEGFNNALLHRLDIDKKWPHISHTKCIALPPDDIVLWKSITMFSTS
jgi:hypothetical protein